MAGEWKTIQQRGVEAYHQHKINQRRRANRTRVTKRESTMTTSAFGVEHGDLVSKADRQHVKRVLLYDKRLPKAGVFTRDKQKRQAARTVAARQGAGTIAGTAAGLGAGALAARKIKNPTASAAALLGGGLAGQMAGANYGRHKGIRAAEKKGYLKR